MAVVAVIAAGEVARVLAGGDGAVVAREQVPSTCVWSTRSAGDQQHVVVAVLADVGGIDVRRVLAGRVGAVMAAEAVAGDVGVIEVRRESTRWSYGSRRSYRRCWMASGACPWRCAVVAGEAGAEDLGVIDHVGRCPGHVVVAVFAAQWSC